MGEGEPFADGLVSVIIAGYNCASFVSATLESVLEQSYPRIELIFVDDGSSDHTEQVVRRFEPRVRYLRQANAGVSRARNAGIAAATGEFLAFLDHDDLWEREKVERQVAALAVQPDVALSFTRARVVGPASMPSHVPMPGSVPGESEAGSSVVRVSHRELFRGNLAALSTILVRRRVATGRLTFRDDLRLAEDYELLLRAAEPGGALFLPETLASYVLLAGRLSARMAEMSLEELRVVEDECLRHPEFERESPRMVRDRRWGLSKQAGYCLWREGRSVEARTLLRRAIRLKPTGLDPWIYWAASWFTRPAPMQE